MVSPMAGVRVVEVTNWMAAPSAGAVLADMGADVVKVEPLTGDVVRGMTRRPKLADGDVDIDHSFQVDNRGKRSIAVALDRPEGAELVRRLVDDADVFLCNLLPHRQARFGLDAGHVARPSAAARPRHADGLRARGPGCLASRLRRHDVLRSRRDHRRHDRARRHRPAARGRRRATTRPGWRWSPPILAALRLVDRTGRGAGRRRQPAGDGGVDDGQRPGADARSTGVRRASATATTSSPRSANRFRCGDDRWIVLNMPEVRWWAPFCDDDRPPRPARRPALRHRPRALRQHAGAHRHARRGVRHPIARRVGSARSTPPA